MASRRKVRRHSHILSFMKLLQSAYTLKCGHRLFPTSLMSSRSKLMEESRRHMSCTVFSFSSSGVSLMSVSTKTLVASLSKMVLTMGYTSLGWSVESSLIAKRKDGQVNSKGATQKVIALDDHTFHSSRKVACSWVML